MGIFDLFDELLDEKSPNSLENKIAGAVDKVEEALSATLEKAESGVERASAAMDKLEAGSSLAEEKITVISEKTQNTIDIVEKKV